MCSRSPRRSLDVASRGRRPGVLAASRIGRLLVLAASLLGARAEADSVDMTVTTLLAGHQDPRDGKIYTVVPAYESVSLVGELRAPHLDELRIVMSGWGVVAFGDPRDGRTASGDLDIAYVEAAAFKRRLAVRVGRQILVGGAARVTQVDGARADWRIIGTPGRQLGLTVYGGAPVTPRFGLSRGDAVGGGRLFYRRSFGTELGLSFIHVEGQGRVARQDVAADARWAPISTVALTGYALMSTRELRLAEATLTASWQPIAKLQFALDYRRSAPELFLPLNSIFSVFSQTTRDEAGTNVFVEVVPRLRLYGDYHVILDESGVGHRGGAKLTVALGQSRHAQLGAEVRVLKLPDDGFVEARLFAIEHLNSVVTITLDADAYKLDRAINGQELSFTAAATLGWDFHPGWRTVLTGIADVTPFVQERFEFIAKLVYNHTLRFREVRP